MRYQVTSYELPPSAGLLDRTTLRTWKVWIRWWRPGLAIFVVMFAIQTAVFRLAFWAGAHPLDFYHLPYKGPRMGDVSGVGGRPWSLDAETLWAIGWFELAVVFSLLVITPILRRHHRPVALAFGAALALSAVQFTASYGQFSPTRFNVLATAAVISPPLLAAAAGRWVRARPRGTVG